MCAGPQTMPAMSSTYVGVIARASFCSTARIGSRPTHQKKEDAGPPIPKDRSKCSGGPARQSAHHAPRLGLRHAAPRPAPAGHPSLLRALPGWKAGYLSLEGNLFLLKKIGRKTEEEEIRVNKGGQDASILRARASRGKAPTSQCLRIWAAKSSGLAARALPRGQGAGSNRGGPIVVRGTSRFAPTTRTFRGGTSRRGPGRRGAGGP